MSKWTDPIFNRLMPCFELLKKEGWTPGVAKDKLKGKVLYLEDCSEEAPCLFMTESDFNTFVRKKGQVDSIYLYYCVEGDGDIAALHEALRMSDLEHRFLRYKSGVSNWSADYLKSIPNGFVYADGHPLVEVTWEGVV